MIPPPDSDYSRIAEGNFGEYRRLLMHRLDGLDHMLSKNTEKLVKLEQTLAVLKFQVGIISGGASIVLSLVVSFIVKAFG